MLVIGGGIAGLRAAVAGARCGARTVLVIKGTLGKSGSSDAAAIGISWQAADGCGGPDDSPEVHYQDVMHAAQGMADARLARIIASEAVERFHELESWGLKMHRDPAGRKPHFGGYACFGSQPRAHGVPAAANGSHTGNMTGCLRQQLPPDLVSVHESTAIIDLLVQGGACVGALGVDRDGAFVVYRAGAVVLAAGGAGQIFPITQSPPAMTGDGYAMAFRAGAELTNMEFMQYMILAVRGPSLRQELGGSFWAVNPVLRNGLGEESLSRYLPPGVTAAEAMWARSLHSPFSCHDVSRWVDIAIHSEIREGRGTPSAHMVVDFSEVDPKRSRRPRPMFWPPPAEMSLPVRQISVAHSGHAVNGGIRVDEWGRTRVPGLLAAGEVIAGPHGADRLGGGMVSACNVFGARAGRSGAEHAKAAGRPALQPEALEKPAARVAAFGRGKEADLAAIRRALRETTRRHLVVIRNADGLRELLSSLNPLQFEALADVPVRDARDLVRVLETDSMLFTVAVMARAALLRTESRGSHYREDYPEKDNVRWQTSILWHNRNGEPVASFGRYRQDPAATVQMGELRETITQGIG